MVPSPKVTTYDKDPKMNAHGVADKVTDILKRGEDHFVMCNFAPPDMVNRLWYYHPILSPFSSVLFLGRTHWYL